MFRKDSGMPHKNSNNDQTAENQIKESMVISSKNIAFLIEGSKLALPSPEVSAAIHLAEINACPFFDCILSYDNNHIGQALQNANEKKQKLIVFNIFQTFKNFSTTRVIIDQLIKPPFIYLFESNKITAIPDWVFNLTADDLDFKFFFAKSVNNYSDYFKLIDEMKMVGQELVDLSNQLSFTELSNYLIKHPNINTIYGLIGKAHLTMLNENDPSHRNEFYRYSQIEIANRKVNIHLFGGKHYQMDSYHRMAEFINKKQTDFMVPGKLLVSLMTTTGVLIDDNKIKVTLHNCHDEHKINEQNQKISNQTNLPDNLIKNIFTGSSPLLFHSGSSGNLQKYFLKSFNQIKIEATANPTAQLLLGLFYLRGLNECVIDQEEAYKWIRRAAYYEKLPAGLCAQGLCYEFGIHQATKDVKKAKDCYKEAARQKYVPGLYELARLLHEKENELQANNCDLQESNVIANYFLTCVKEDYPMAQYKLGMCYYEGIIIDKDHQRAFELIHQSAQSGYALAKQMVGSFYEKGIGVSEDITKAKEWYHSALNQGIRQCQDDLVRLRKHTCSIS